MGPGFSDKLLLSLLGQPFMDKSLILWTSLMGQVIIVFVGQAFWDKLFSL